jgi:hypothetical protein
LAGNPPSAKETKRQGDEDCDPLVADAVAEPSQRFTHQFDCTDESGSGKPNHRADNDRQGEKHRGASLPDGCSDAIPDALEHAV